ncbi:MAG: hypothetical protein M3297_12260 [Thermoproteota archaeon]|nr:hypothetical protein [Thermoproteota archaeon]
MKKPISTIIKDQADQLAIERASNKSPLFDRKIETATEGLIRISIGRFLISYL